MLNAQLHSTRMTIKGAEPRANPSSSTLRTEKLHYLLDHLPTFLCYNSGLSIGNRDRQVKSRKVCLHLCYQTCVRIADISEKSDSQVAHTQTPTASPTVGSSSNLCFHFSYATRSQLHANAVPDTASSLEELRTECRALPFQLSENVPLCSVGWS